MEAPWHVITIAPVEEGVTHQDSGESTDHGSHTDKNDPIDNSADHKIENIMIQADDMTSTLLSTDNDSVIIPQQMFVNVRSNQTNNNPLPSAISFMEYVKSEHEVGNPSQSEDLDVKPHVLRLTDVKLEISNELSSEVQNLTPLYEAQMHKQEKDDENDYDVTEYAAVTSQQSVDKACSSGGDHRNSDSELSDSVVKFEESEHCFETPIDLDFNLCESATEQSISVKHRHPLCRPTVPIRHWKCVICHKACINNATLQMHYHINHDFKINEQYFGMVCNLCGKRFVSMKQYMLHKKQNHPDWNDVEIYRNQCSMCLAQFDTEYKLKVHCLLNHKKPFTEFSAQRCQFCMKSFVSIPDFQIHLCNHLLPEVRMKRSYACAKCHLWFEDEVNFNKHYASLHIDLPRLRKCFSCLSSDCEWVGLVKPTNQSCGKIRNCIYCDRKFVNKQMIAHRYKHMNEISKDELWVCSLCDESVLTFPCFRSHLAQKHGVDCSTICARCRFVCKSIKELSAHKRTHRLARYRCEVCATGFTLQSKYLSHMIWHRHKFDTRFECHFTNCGASFASRWALVKHVTVHMTKQKDHTAYCDQCSQSFKSKRAYKLHACLTQKFPIKTCNGCQISFVDTYDFVNHKCEASDQVDSDKVASSQVASGQMASRQFATDQVASTTMTLQTIKQTRSAGPRKHVIGPVKRGKGPKAGTKREACFGNQCSKCGQVFSTTKSFVFHLRTNHLPSVCNNPPPRQTPSCKDTADAYVYRCPRCTEKFRSTMALYEHSLHVHRESNADVGCVYKCAKCPDEFVKAVDLCDHMVAKHGHSKRGCRSKSCKQAPVNPKVNTGRGVLYCAYTPVNKANCTESRASIPQRDDDKVATPGSNTSISKSSMLEYQRLVHEDDSQKLKEDFETLSNRTKTCGLCNKTYKFVHSCLKSNDV